MALTDLERLFVSQTASQLWQQDLLTNIYFQGSSVGANLRAMLLGQKPVKPLTNPFDEAITGRLRSDSVALRQGADNVKEAASMFGVAAGAAGAMKSVLQEMRDMTDKIAKGELSASELDVQNRYNALRDQISGIVQSARFNGISLVDNMKWNTDQISAEGKVHIQSWPGGGFDVQMPALNAASADLEGTGLVADLSAQQAALDKNLGLVSTVEDMAVRRKESLSYQASALSGQADLLDQAVAARRQTPASSLEEILLRLLMRNSGTLVDEAG